jgi:hypothetical protein
MRINFFHLSLLQKSLFRHSRERGNLDLLESRRWRDWIPDRALLARNDEFPFMWGVLQEAHLIRISPGRERGRMR